MPFRVRVPELWVKVPALEMEPAILKVLLAWAINVDEVAMVKPPPIVRVVELALAEQVAAFVPSPQVSVPATDSAPAGKF